MVALARQCVRQAMLLSSMTSLDRGCSYGLLFMFRKLKWREDLGSHPAATDPGILSDFGGNRYAVVAMQS